MQTDLRDVFRRGESIEWPGSTAVSLIEQLRNNEALGWERMMRLYAPVVYRWCRRRGLTAHDSADVAQEIFHSASRSIHRFHRDGANTTFRGWLWRITCRRTADFFRKESCAPLAVGGQHATEWFETIPAPNSDPPEDPSKDAAGEGGGEPEQISPAVLTALQQVRQDFAASTWQAFWKTCVDGKTPAEVAAEMELSVNAVYLARSRILRRLREALGDVHERP